MTELLIRLFVKNPQDIGNIKVRERYGRLGSIVGIICNLLLCAVKILTGLAVGSISVIADGLNNLSDTGSSVITMIGFKLAGKPADKDHPFGHGRTEYLSAFIVSILIIIVGFELLTSSASTLIAGDPAPKYSIWALITLSASVLIKAWLFFFNRRLGKKIDSSALLATAQDSINDVIATLAILVAAVISTLISLPFNLDAVMAAGVALFILWSGIASAKDTINEMLGTPPDPRLVEQLREGILSFDGFLGVHDLIVHNYGPGRQFASVHVEVPQDIDIVSCHERIDLCEKLIGEKTGISLVIHMDPIDVNNERVAQTKSAVDDVIKAIDGRLTLHDFRMTPAAAHRTNLIFDVVVPADLKLTKLELNRIICHKAREIDPSFCCVITFDNDFT